MHWHGYGKDMSEIKENSNIELLKDIRGSYTILDYIKDNADKDFDELPFNEADNLMLCQLSYLDYTDFVPGLNVEKQSVYLRDIYADPNYDNLFKKYWYVENNKELIEGLVNSKRFGDLKLNFFVDVYNEEKDAQFAAVTYIYDNSDVFIAFRGTDATLVGWKEDMKLAYSKPTRAQELALGYLTEVVHKIAGSFRCGGHSKGGNLAVYSCMMANEDITNRLIKVYSNDGPGFRPEIIANSNMSVIKDKIYKFIPRESIVGIIMNEDDDFKIVDSTTIGTLQHNLYTWKCDENGNIITCNDMSVIKKTYDNVLNQWIYSLSVEEIDAFIDGVFEILSSKDAKNVFDLIVDPIKTISAMSVTYKNLSEESKQNFNELLSRFKSISKELFADEIKHHFKL